MKPTVSIITPTIDTPRFLAAAIKSVPYGGGCDVEHIVVYDGDSSELTKLIAEFPWIRMVPGAGRGATAAIAQGNSLAIGEFIIVLNSDDLMLPGAIDVLRRCAAERPEIEVWTGGTRIFTQGSDGGVQIIRTLDDPATTALTLSNVLDDLPLMTARFIRREIYQRIGNLDERYSTCSDREFAIRMVISGVREAPLGVLVSELRMHDESATIHRRRHEVPPYLAQHVDLAWEYMRNRDISPALRTALRGWHARETLRKAFHELASGQIARLFRTSAVAFVRDCRWPLRALSSVAAFKIRRRGSV